MDQVQILHLFGERPTFIANLNQLRTMALAMSRGQESDSNQAMSSFFFFIHFFSFWELDLCDWLSIVSWQLCLLTKASQKQKGHSRSFCETLKKGCVTFSPILQSLSPGKRKFLSKHSISLLFVVLFSRALVRTNPNIKKSLTLASSLDASQS